MINEHEEMGNVIDKEGEKFEMGYDTDEEGEELEDEESGLGSYEDDGEEGEESEEGSEEDGEEGEGSEEGSEEDGEEGEGSEEGSKDYGGSGLGIYEDEGEEGSEGYGGSGLGSYEDEGEEGSEEDSEEGEGSEEGSEEDGEEGEGSEEGSEGYGGSGLGSYENEGEEGEGSEEGSEGDEGSEENEEREEFEIGEEGEGSEEDDEDERCEASGCFKWGKMFVPHSSSEEYEEEESDEEEEEDGEDERREASPCVKSGKQFVACPTSEEHEEDEGREDDEIVDGPEDKESEGDEESDISDSEINEYKEAVHKLLKFRTYKIKGPNGQFRCPFCVGMENQEYTRLLEHAVQVAEGSTESAKQRANHFAMAKYLAIDLASEVEQLPPSANRILGNLTLEIDLRKKNMDRLQSKYEDKTMVVRKMLEEKDETQRTFFEEARNMLCIARDQSKRVLEQQEMLSFDFENKRQRLNSWSEELNKREAALTEKRMMDDLMRKKNDLDLLEAGKELMKGLEDMPSHCRVKIGVKRRWVEIDEKAFMSACKKRYRLNEAETKAFELCYFWVKEMSDDKGNPQRLLEENEKLLRGLKDKWGNKIYNAVVAVVEYNSNRNGMELWNFEEGRKASYCEVIRYVFSRWKTLQCKRDEIDEVIKTLF